MQQEFAAEMKKKTEKIKPRLIGCIWENNNNNDGEQELPCSAIIWEVLMKRAMLFDDEQPIILTDTTERLDLDTNSTSPSRSEQQPRKMKIPDDAVKDLVRLVHGNLHSRKFLVKEYQAYRAKMHEGDAGFVEYTNESVASKIKHIAEWKQCPEEGEIQNKMCWYCSKETLQGFGLEELKLPNSWNYLLPIEKTVKKKKAKVLSVIESPSVTVENK
jgi:chromatin assembly factor 1 subunit A